VSWEEEDTAVQQGRHSRATKAEAVHRRHNHMHGRAWWPCMVHSRPCVCLLSHNLRDFSG